MPSNQINPFNYDIDKFDSGFLGPITDSNFRTFLFTHNLPVVNPIIGGILGGNPWTDRGTEFSISNTNPNVVDVPNLVNVANTPSVYNNLTNPRQVNLTSNLQNVNPEIANILGVTTPQQAGLGVDSSVQMNLTSTVTDLPSLSDVAEIPSSLNNFTNLRQSVLDKNPELVELMTWYPDYAYLFYSENDTYNTSYGVPSTLKLGFAGNTESWVSDGGYVSTTHEIRDMGYFKLNNKYGPKDLVAYEAQNNASPPGTLQALSQTLVSQNTGFIQYNPSVQGDFRDQLLSRTLGVGIIPFSTIGSGINYKPDGANISELDEIARKRRGVELLNRVKLNFTDSTFGALNLNPFSLLAGGSLINKDYTITVSNNLVGKSVSFIKNLAGFNSLNSRMKEGDFQQNIPFNTDSYGGSNPQEDIQKGLLQRTGKATRDLMLQTIKINKYGPVFESDNFGGTAVNLLRKLIGKGKEGIDENSRNNGTYLSNTPVDSDTKKGSKKNESVSIPTSTLTSELLSKSKTIDGGFYGKNEPNQQSSKSESQINYGFDSIDANDNIKEPDEFSWEFRTETTKTTTFKTIEITQTIPTEQSVDPDVYADLADGWVGAGVPITKTISKTIATDVFDTQIPNPFKRKGLLKYTQDIVNLSLADLTKPGGYIGYFDSAESGILNGAHKTGANYKTKPVLPSKGNQVRNVTIKAADDGTNPRIEGGDLYCRSWTRRKQYDNYTDLVRKGGNWWRDVRNEMKSEGSGESMLTLNYNEGNMGMPKIAWDSGDVERFKKLNIDKSPNADTQKIRGLAIPYMFSIENLAWKDAPQMRDLPNCEIGPNGGRIMWFPPYDINFSDSTSISWDTTNFIGRGEPIYTYNHTERSGQLSWTIVVDHPAVLNQLRKDFTSKFSVDVTPDQIDTIYHSFFAGCNIDDIELLFKDFVKPKKAPNLDTTPFTKVQPTKPNPPPIKSITFYMENCVKDGTVNGIDYSTPNGIGRDPEKDIMNGYETIYSYIGAGIKQNTATGDYKKYQNFPMCEDTKGLNMGEGFGEKAPYANQSQYIYSTIGIEKTKLGDLQKMADFLLTADGKNYSINIESSTSKADNEGGVNTQLSKDRAQNLKNLILKYFNKGLDGQPKELKIPYIEAANGKLYYYPTEEELISDQNRWPELKPKAQSGGGNGADDGGNPCDIQASFAFSPDANSLTSKKARFVKVTLEENTAQQVKLLNQINDELNKDFIDKQKASNEALIKEALKEIGNSWINECDYFLRMEKDQPFVYKNFSEKIKYFHPAFHAITPEGFNSRLTFLQQCTRQGPQILKDDLPSNMVFGRPPICVLRIGDFYHTKIVIDSMNFTFDPLQWDLNPEGIGVQPMLAKIDMGFKFIGGSSLGGPIKQLQNAVSFNFFANTSVYNPVEQLEILMAKRQLLTDKSDFGIYGAFKTPADADKYYKNLFSTTQTTEPKTPINGASSDGAPNASDTTKAATDDATKKATEENAPVSTETNANAGTQPATTSTDIPLKYSFESDNGDDAHNFNTVGRMDSMIGEALEKLYSQGLNPIVKDIKATITKRTGFTKPYLTEWSATVSDNKDSDAWMGFTSRGAFGADNKNRARQQRFGPKCCHCNPPITNNVCSSCKDFTKNPPVQDSPSNGCDDIGTTLEFRLARNFKAMKFKDVAELSGANPGWTQIFTMFTKADKPNIVKK